MPKAMVTTIDNPYDYFTQFDEWLEYDLEKGYNTLQYLARVAVYSPESSEADISEAINKAVDDIVRLNVLGIYKKVYEEAPNT